jgi:hypothetical protein
MIELTQDNLEEYFTVADSNNSWLQEKTNTFDFISRSSKTLLVTIGDSWTYGGDLAPQLRQQQVYGNQLSTMLQSDWLNLSLPAQSNFWIASMVEEFTAIYNQLNYDKVILVCVFTGAGRWFNTYLDQYIKYTDWFQEIDNDFYILFKKLNRECIRRICDAIAGTQIILKVGTNFVDQIGFDQLNPQQILSRPWYQVLDDVVISDKEQVYHCVYHERLSTALEFIDKKLHNQYKEWIIKITDEDYTRLDVLQSDSYVNSHPTPESHLKWAKYILQELECK